MVTFILRRKEERKEKETNYKPVFESLLLISFSSEHSVNCMNPSVGKTSHCKLYGLAENQSQEGSD